MSDKQQELLDVCKYLLHLADTTEGITVKGMLLHAADEIMLGKHEREQVAEGQTQLGYIGGP